jgi:hypothetical protein
MHAGNGQLHQIDKSRQLQCKLYLAAKKCRERRFHALYDRIFRPDVLWRAWQEVKANGGSAGVDGVSLEEVERPFLEVIAADLKAGRYQPQPVLRVYIPKPDGRQRPLGIPTVRDRIVQQACRIVIEPVFEANFQNQSYGFRPRRSAAQAVRAHKAEHAVDLDTGAVLAVTLQGADKGDTTTLDETLGEAGMAVAEQVGREAELRPHEAPRVNMAGIEETVTDKGYHSGAVVKRMKAYGMRTYIPEKKQKGRRNWEGKAEEQQAVYANRRRVRGEYGKSLLRRRGELVERSFAHCYETGAMRRCHLRGQENILKRQLVHVGAFNLSLILRKLLGAGTPREWKNRVDRLVLTLYLLFTCRINQKRLRRISASVAKCFVRSRIRLRRPTCRKSATCTPGC